MKIQILDEWQQWVEAERIIATAFMFDWNEEESKKKYREQAEGKAPRREETWGLFSDQDRLVSAVITSPLRLSFAGEEISARELHMVGSLPEVRGGGNIRRLVEAILKRSAERGELFATLMPFSAAFYRKFGFERCSALLRQRFPIGQLAGFRCDWDMRRVESQADVDELKNLYISLAGRRNLAELRPEDFWVYHGSGEYGERNFWEKGKVLYTYLLADGQGKSRGYLRFMFEEGANGPFIGEMNVTELMYDGPEALRNLLGFVYGLRAKITHVRLSSPEFLDFSVLLPECGEVERSIEGGMMARITDVPRVLERLPLPDACCFTLEVKDSFLPGNSGIYRISREKGRTFVSRTEGPADLTLTQETLVPLCAGAMDLDTALFRADTILRDREEILREIFVKRPVGLGA
ncbi:MAG: GNAT family N-acetyltransferase [Oscillospiraceae bacterium]|nr:GNAT family N-acetyltransferase [Oscillospiraceae bacterium]